MVWSDFKITPFWRLIQTVMAKSIYETAVKLSKNSKLRPLPQNTLLKMYEVSDGSNPVVLTNVIKHFFLTGCMGQMQFNHVLKYAAAFEGIYTTAGIVYKA